MPLYKLTKNVLSVKNDPVAFLNGITSNDMAAADNAFLNIHGRIVATFDQIKVSDQEYWILVEAEFVEGLLSHIDKYIKLSGVEVKRLDKQVYFDLQADQPLEEGDQIIPQNKGRLIITDHQRPEDVSADEYTLFRLNNNIPVHGLDYGDEMLLNVSEEHFVSFTKGCYLGQEPISKVHNRSKPSWKLVVRAEDECSDEERAKMTSKAKNLDSGKVMGFVFTKNN